MKAEPSTTQSNVTAKDEKEAQHVQEPDGKSSNHCKGLTRQWVSSIIVSITYIIIGTALGWPAPVLKRMKEHGDPVNMTDTDAMLMVTLFYAGNMLTPIPSGWLSDWFGRKTIMIYLTSLPVASWTFIWVAKPIAMVHVGRFLMGMYSGLALTVWPLYLGEISEPKVRGRASSILQLTASIGVIFSYIVGPHVSYSTFAIILGFFPVVHFFLLFAIPESPYWYTLKGKDEKAARSLAWLRGGQVGNKDVDEEVNEVLQAVHSDIVKPKHFKMLFTTKHYRKALIIVEVLAAGQRFSGITNILAYVSITLPELETLNADRSGILTSVFQALGVVVALPLVDRFGRIPLLITSCIGSGVSILAASVWYFINRSSFDEGSLKWMPVTLFCIFGLFLNIGLAPLVAVLQGEMFPSHLKGRASAITSIVLSVSSVIVNFTYIPLANSVGMWSNFLIYALACFACLVFTCTYVFETKGKTLPEIQKRLTTGKFPDDRISHE